MKLRARYQQTLIHEKEAPVSPASVLRTSIKDVQKDNRDDVPVPYYELDYFTIDVHSALLNNTLEDAIDQLEQSKNPLAVEGALFHRNDNDETPLHVAAYSAKPDLAIRLLEVIPTELQSKILMTRDCQGNTPLHLACANNEDTDFLLVKNLIMYLPATLELTNKQLDTPLHLLVASPSFEKTGDIQKEVAAEEAISSLLEMAPHLATVPNESGLTLLHTAIASGSYERVLVQLLKHAQEAAFFQEKHGMLPLHFAAAWAKAPWTFVGQLIYANSDSLLTSSENGDTPLHTLVANARKGVKKHAFVDRNTMKIAELLCGSSEDVSPISARNSKDLTPLHCCALFNTPPQITRILMQSPMAGMASGMTTPFGATPLHLACAVSKIDDENIAALATRHACSTKDSYGLIPLMIAAQNVKVSSSAVKLLCKKDPRSTTEVNDDERIALHLALMTPNAKESVVKQLVKANPDSVTNADKKGNTALHLACLYHWSADIIECMLERNPEARFFRNHKNQTPLDLAVGASKKVIGMLNGSIQVAKKVGTTSRRTRTVHVASLVSV